jgi:hypothetical protein
MSNHYQVLVIGGGQDSVASKYLSKKVLKIGIVDPSEKHYYPAVDTCGCWNFDIKKTIRNEKILFKTNLDKRCSFSI